jgi:hypothetical protein
MIIIHLLTSHSALRARRARHFYYAWMYQKPSMIYEATILIRNGSLEEALRRQSAGNNNAPHARICSKSGFRKNSLCLYWPGLLPYA